MANNRALRRFGWFGVPIVLIVLLVVFWNWDWFIPIVQTRASAAIGHPVSIAHLHVSLGRVVRIAADDVVVGNPPDWPADDPSLAAVKRLVLDVDALGYLQGHGLVLPMIGLDSPKVYVAETKDGTANFTVPENASKSGAGTTPPKIGDLRINDGEIHTVMPKFKTDFTAKVETKGDGPDATIVVDAKGTYAAQPIIAKLTGGALLSLRDHDHPWPVDLALANGPTKVALNGTLQDPLAFKGADVTLKFSGPNMGLLEPLVGFPIPKTPAYQLTGKLDLHGLENIRFEDFRGRLGSSDVGGSIDIKPGAAVANGKSRPVVTMDLVSEKVDLADLSGFIGGSPRSKTTADATPAEREAAAKAASSPRLLPDTAVSVPRLGWADIHTRYRAKHIQGRSMPLDDLSVALDVVDSQIKVHPISFGVGKGRLSANIDLTPETGKKLHAKVDLRMQNLDVSRLMAATHTFEGAGSVSGVGALDSTGDSLSTLLGNGNGEVKMAMAGGNLSAILVDLTGLQFGNALLSALGIPQKTPVECFVGDLILKRGVLNFNAVTLDTGEGITNVGGNVDLGKETIDLGLKTDSKHFSVGSLPTRIDIGGTFKSPSIRPGAEVAARGGAAVGLAVLFAPLAILPTIQFGTSDAEDERCGKLLQQARAGAGGKALPAEPKK